MMGLWCTAAQAQTPTDSTGGRTATPVGPCLIDGPTRCDEVLDSVIVSFRVVRYEYAAGHRTTRLDSTTLRHFQGEPLSEALTYGSGLSIKQYGSGMLATPAFRGTGASQTAVRWNGVPIQSTTLGLQDLALIPSLAGDGVTLVHGATGSQTGDASLGGGILIGSSAQGQRGFGLSVQESYSTLNNHSTGVIARYGGEKVQGTTRFYRADWGNEFTYVNPDNFAQRVELENKSPLTQTAFLQDFHWDAGKKVSVWASTWLEHTDRQLQQTIGVPDQEETQLDQNQRFAAGFHWRHEKGWTDLNAGFTREVIDYQQPDADIYSKSTAFQYLLNVNHTRSVGGWWFKGGVRQQWFAAAFSNYGGADALESRQEVYAQAKFGSPRFLLDLGARQPFSTDFTAPLLPSVGASFALLKGEKGALHVKGALARSYRAPSLNDRYWTPGGNPGLVPETGWSAEGGLEAELSVGHWQVKAEATHFQLWVNDWILWVPVTTTIWSPFNVNRVHSRGLEFSAECSYRSGDWLVGLNGQYTYTLAEGDDGEGPLESANGKQLIYVPRHLGNTRLRLGWKGLELWGLAHTTSLRYSTRDNSSFVQGYTLYHAGLSQHLDWQRHGIDLGLQVRNLTAEVYENYDGRGQPGRYYVLQLTYSLQPTTKPNRP